MNIGCSSQKKQACYCENECGCKGNRPHKNSECDTSCEPWHKK